MKKFLFLAVTLIMSVTSAWAGITDPISYGALGTSATESWALVSSAAPGLLNPTGATYTVTVENLRVLERTVDVEESGVLASTFMYKGGDHRIDIAGVEVVDGSGNIVSFDYHFGYSGGKKVNNTYNVFTPAGQYTFRYYAIYSSGSYDTNGEITNVFTPQTKEDYDLQTLISEAEALYNANSEPQTGKNLITQNKQFSSPYTYEGSTDNLLDGNLGTYWHSSWANSVAPHVHYLQVELSEAIDGTLQLTMGRRSDAANDHPVKMTVEYSADGTSYTQASEVMEFSATTGYVKGTFNLPTAAKYLRFFNEESNGTYQRGYWHCSEFQLNTISTSLNETYPTDAANMLAAINTAKGVSTATQNDVNTLQAALNAYKNAAAPTYYVTITGAPEGTKIGYKGNKYADGETFKAESVNTTDITPDNLEGYKVSVNVNGNSIIVTYYELIKTNQLYVLSTTGRGAWVVSGDDFMSTANASVAKDIDTTDAYQLFAIYQYDGAYYLWNEGAQHFINNAGKVVGIQSASPIAWTEEAGVTYFFHFTDAEGKYININGSKAMDICDWSYADEGNMMHLTPVEGFDADAVEAVINADFNEKTYTVTVTGATDGRLIYDGNEYADEDTFKAAGLNSTDISAKELLGYQSSVSMNGTEITVTYTAINYSFEISQAPVNEEWQVGTKFYTIKEKRNGYFYASKIPAITDKTTPTDDDGKWAVIANGTHVQFMNKATQEVLTFASAANDAQADMTDNLNDPYSLFDVVTYKNAIFEGGFECFKIAGEVAYPNDKSGNLAIWNSEQALWGWGGSQASPKNGDDGSKFQFALVETFGEANWAGLADLVATAKSYTVGAGLGQFSWIVYDEDYTSDWAESLEFYEGCVEAQDGDADFVDFLIESLNEAIGQLQLNLPKPNTFLRVKGAASGNYIAGDNSISNGRAGMTADKDASSILYYTEDGELIGYQSGLGFIDTFHRATVGSTFEHHTFSASSYGNKGAYTLESDFANGSKVFYDGTTDINRNSAANSVNCAWYLEEVTELPVTVTSAGYATLCSPVNLTIPTGVKAYGMTVANEKYLSPEEIDTTIPANTGVVLEAAADTYNFAITTNAGSATSVLNGTYATIASDEADGNYVFSIKDGTPGFYKFVGSELKGFKAYYQTSVASINGFSIDFGGQTVGVNSVISATNLKAGYDIQGRMINKMQKGINVINGKKIIK